MVHCCDAAGWPVGRQWAHIFSRLHRIYRHRTVDNLLCNRSRYCEFVWSSSSHSAFFVGCVSAQRGDRDSSAMHWSVLIKLYDFFMYFIGQVSATVAVSALWPLFVLIANDFPFFGLLYSHFRPRPLLSLSAKARCVCMCCVYECTAHKLNKKPPNRIYEYYL